MGNDDLPFMMDEAEILAIITALRLFSEPISVIEWGGGNSTLYFPKLMVSGSEWDSIEHNPEWANRGKALLEKPGYSNIRIHFVPTNKPYQEGLLDGDFETFRDYILYPKKLRKLFQIILVDGRARVECMKTGWNLLDVNGIMILHDAQRREYDKGIPEECYWIRIVNPLINNEGKVSTLFMSKSLSRITQLQHQVKTVLPNHIVISTKSESDRLAEPMTASAQFVQTKPVNYKPKLKYSFGMIVLNGDDFIEYALKSVYDFAHEIIIVEGAVEEAVFMVGLDGGSRDNTIKLIESFPDPDNKITLIRGRWVDKTQQSNVYMRVATGDYVWQLDSDEVYKWEDLVQIDDILASNRNRVDMVSFTSINFYHNMWTVGKGGRWEEKSDPFRRIFKREQGCYFSTHWPPTVVYTDTSMGRSHLQAESIEKDYGIYLYHYSYVTKKQVEEKVEYYNRKGYSPIVGSDLGTWYERVWSKWTQPGCEVEKLYGSHVNTRKPTWTEYFQGDHPKVVKSHPLFNVDRPARATETISKSDYPEFWNLAGQAETGCFSPVFRSLMEAHGYTTDSNQAGYAKLLKERHGTEYGGWWVCPDRLNKNSIIYSFGIGEDISFDLSMIDKYGVEIHAFDPTPRALEHVSKQGVSEQLHVHDIALAAHDGEELFYPPDNKEHVSHTLVTKPQTAALALRVNVQRIATIMQELGHRRIDLLKMDIEGSEYEVLQDILDSKVDVDQILVEFHHNVYPGLTVSHTQEMIGRLTRAGYEMFSVDDSDCCFIKKRQDAVRVYNLGGRRDIIQFYSGPDVTWLGTNVDYRTVDIIPNFNPDICNGIEDLKDIPDVTADILITTQVIMYTPNPHKAFQEMSRVLKPKGILFCVTPMLYPRDEKANPHYEDCTRIYSDAFLERESFLQQLQRFTEIYGMDVSLQNLNSVMRLDGEGYPTYNVYDLKQTQGLFSEMHVYPAYDSPKTGTIQLVVVARK